MYYPINQWGYAKMKYLVEEEVAKEIAECLKGGMSIDAIAKKFDLMPAYAEALCTKKIVAYAYLFEGIDVVVNESPKEETSDKPDLNAIAGALRDKLTTLEIIAQAYNVSMRKLEKELKDARLNYRLSTTLYDKLMKGELTIKAVCDLTGFSRAQVRECLPDDFNPDLRQQKVIPDEVFAKNIRGEMTAREISRVYKISYPTVLKRIQGYKDKHGSEDLLARYQELKDAVCEFLGAADNQDAAGAEAALIRLRTYTE